MADPIQIVETFCALMEQRDAAALRPYLSADAVYQNVGMPATVGSDAIAENLGQQFAVFPDSYAYKMIKTPAGEVVGVPVMGTFVVRDGKIARWTDYWDTTLPQKMMTGIEVADLVPSDYLSI